MFKTKIKNIILYSLTLVLISAGIVLNTNHNNISATAASEFQDLEVDIASYIGGSDYDSINSTEIQPDGDILIAGLITDGYNYGFSPTLIDGGGIGALMILNSDNVIQSVTRFPGDITDMDINRSNGKIAVVGSFGLYYLEEDGQTIIFSTQLDQGTSQEQSSKPENFFSRVDIADNGKIATLNQTRVELWNEDGSKTTPGSHIVNGAALVTDIAYDSNNSNYIVVGEVQRDNPDPKYCLQYRSGFMNAFNLDFSTKWRNYDWSIQAVKGYPQDSGLSREASLPNNERDLCADFMPKRISFGYDGLLYMAAESAGGNTVMDYHPRTLEPINQNDFDAFTRASTSSDQHFTVFARYNPATGIPDISQFLVARGSKPSGPGEAPANTLVPKSITADENGTVFIGASSFAHFPGKFVYPKLSGQAGVPLNSINGEVYDGNYVGLQANASNPLQTLDYYDFDFRLGESYFAEIPADFGRRNYSHSFSMNESLGRVMDIAAVNGQRVIVGRSEVRTQPRNDGSTNFASEMYTINGFQSGRNGNAEGYFAAWDKTIYESVINDITFDSANSQYVVDFSTTNFIPGANDRRVHFYFNTENEDVKNKIYTSPQDYTLAANLVPLDVTELCITSAETDDEIIEQSGNCFPLPNTDDEDVDGDGLTRAEEIILGTDVFNNDTDNDGIDDAIEVGNDINNPINTDSSDVIDALESNIIDTDGDGLVDNQDPFNQDNCKPDNTIGICDRDNDGLTNDEEIILGTIRTKPDSDDDGLNDFYEAVVYGSDSDAGFSGGQRRGADTDDDGKLDADEVGFDLDNPIDTDGDGIPDILESSTTDSDNDGNPDETDADSSPCTLDNTLPFCDIDSDGLTNSQEDYFGTDKNNSDTDNDGLSDGVEIGSDLANPLDTDNDGIINALQSNAPVDNDNDGVFSDVDPDDNDICNPNTTDGSCDTDNDGLTNAQEDIVGTNKALADSDNDGINDGIEVGDVNNPVDSDSDGTIDALEDNTVDADSDGLFLHQDINDNDICTPNQVDNSCFGDSDNDGVTSNVDPDDNNNCVPNPNFSGCDQDADGLTNLEEDNLGTDKTLFDTDSDGLSDGAEVNTHNTNPNLADTDNGGLNDGDEIAQNKNPNDPSDDIDPMDNDGDGVLDTIDPDDNDKCNPINTFAECDIDSDGLTNAQEDNLGTDKNLADSDGDGINDYLETVNISNPVDQDNDGIIDALEDNTVDADNDGVFLHLDINDADICIPNQIDSSCFEDSDNDGILSNIDPDDNDICNPNTTDGSCDTDNDGLTNSQEDIVGTNKAIADTDNDGINDNIEVGNTSNPTDTDNDGTIDALEDNTVDVDSDGLFLHQDINDNDICTPNQVDNSCFGDSDNDGVTSNIDPDDNDKCNPNPIDSDCNEGEACQVGGDLDNDCDGISNIDEDNFLNNGDANFDGIADKNQGNVVSINDLSDGLVTFEIVNSTQQCNEISFIGSLSESSLSLQDPEFDYPLGLIDFEIACSGQTQVALYFHNADTAQNYFLRKFVTQNSFNSFTEFKNVDNQISFENGYIKVIYSVEDNIEGDDNINVGVIRDPIGLAVKSAVSQEVESGKNENTKIDRPLVRTGGQNISFSDLIGLSYFLFAFIILSFAVKGIEKK